MVKNMKRFSISLAFREMQIKTTVRFQLTPIRMAMIKKMQTITSVGMAVAKLEPSYFAGGNVKWYS